MVAGLMAMIMRAQLWEPDSHLVSGQQYNELFTMHGAIMLLLFATPLFVGFANEIMPLHIGAPRPGSSSSTGPAPYGAASSPSSRRCCSPSGSHGLYVRG
jgi:hypothetical protein